MDKEEILKPYIDGFNVHKNEALFCMEAYKDQELSELQEKYNQLEERNLELENQKDPYRDLLLYDSLELQKSRYDKLEEAFRELLTYVDERNATIDSTWYMFNQEFLYKWTTKAGLKE